MPKVDFWKMSKSLGPPPPPPPPSEFFIGFFVFGARALCPWRLALAPLSAYALSLQDVQNVQNIQNIQDIQDLDCLIEVLNNLKE